MYVRYLHRKTLILLSLSTTSRSAVKILKVNIKMIFLVLSLISAIIYALVNPFYTRLHATGLWAGRILASPGTEEMMPTGLQDALTDGWPSTMCLISSLLPVLVVVFGFVYSWWMAFVELILAISLFALFDRVLVIVPNNVVRYLGVLLKHANKRKADYSKKNDFQRELAIDSNAV